MGKTVSVNTDRRIECVPAGGWDDGESGTDISTLLRVKQITSEDPLTNMGSSSRRSVATSVGRESNEGWGHMYICICDDSLCCVARN